MVEYFVEEAPRKLTQLEHWGCPWSREDGRHVAARAFGGMTTKRTWFAADKIGFHMLHTLFQTLAAIPVDRPLRRVLRAPKLLVDDGAAAACIGIDMRDRRR